MNFFRMLMFCDFLEKYNQRSTQNFRRQIDWMYSVIIWSKCCDTVLVRAGQFLTKRFLSLVPMDFRLSLLEVALADRLPVSLYSWMVS